MTCGSLTREEVSIQIHETDTIDADVFLGADGLWRIEGGAVNVRSLNDAGGARSFTKRGTKPLYVMDAAYTGTTSVTERRFTN